MYAVILGKTLMPHPYETIEEAQKAATGMLLSRSRERIAQVVPVAPGRIGGIGDPVLVAKRSKAGAPIKWTNPTPPTPDKKD